MMMNKEKSKRFKCPICKKTFKEEIEFNEHIERHAVISSRGNYVGRS